MDERRERHFGQLIKEDVGRAASELDRFSKNFVSFINHRPVVHVLVGIIATEFGYLGYLSQQPATSEKVMAVITNPTGMQAAAFIVVMALGAEILTSRSSSSPDRLNLQ